MPPGLASGVVRMEQKNNTLLEMGFYDDGPFEIKYSTPEGLDEVAVPANSYLGVSGIHQITPSH